MALFQSIEKQGNFLFKYRGQFPILLFFLAIPFIYSTDYHLLNEKYNTFLLYISVALSIVGFLIRFYTIGTTTSGTSGRNTKKQIASILNTKGIYSLSYLGLSNNISALLIVPFLASISYVIQRYIIFLSKN